MSELSERDIRGLLGVLGDAGAAEDLEQFRSVLLPGLRSLLAADFALYNEVDLRTRTAVARADPADAVRPAHSAYELASMLPAWAGVTIGLVFVRGARDFEVRERELVELARAGVILAYDRAKRATLATEGPGIVKRFLRVPGTDRARELLCVGGMAVVDLDRVAAMVTSLAA